MARWAPSTVLASDSDVLIAMGTLSEHTDADELRFPIREAMPGPNDDYVISFVLFHKRGFGVPLHPFFRGLLHYHGLELQHRVV